MKNLSRNISLLAVVAVTFCTGCATKYSDMVRFVPADRAGAGYADQLFDAVNTSVPFEISRGDFVVNHSEDGQTCWVVLGDARRTKDLIACLKKSPEWRYSRTSSVRTSARSYFGLASKAAEYNSDGSVKSHDALASIRTSNRREI